MIVNLLAAFLIAFEGGLDPAVAPSVAPALAEQPPLVAGRPRKGDSWTYRNFQIPSGQLNRTWKEAVTEVTDDGFWLARTDRLATTDRQVVQAPEFIRFEEHVPSQPLFVGKRWSSTLVVNGMPSGEMQFSVLRQERVKTEAGKFDSFAVDLVVRAPTGGFHQIIWYSASARNFVKQVYLKDGQPFQGSELIRYKLR